jgi:microcystin-dependent protein
LAKTDIPQSQREPVSFGSRHFRERQMDFYLGQIGIFGFNFAPTQWAMCTGTILPISQNTALFALIGTFYGGNGQTTFGLPDLRSRTPLGSDNNYPIGELAGMENVTLINTQIPQHTHLVAASNGNASVFGIDNAIFAQGNHRNTATKAYGPVTGTVPLNAGSVSLQGGSQPHNNIQPMQAVNFCIATSGIFPPRG